MKSVIDQIQEALKMNAETLDLSNNKLTTLPPEIGQLTKRGCRVIV